MPKFEAVPYEPIPEPRSAPEMAGLTLDDQIRLTAQRQIEGSRASLLEAYCMLGRFEEALVIISYDLTGRREWIQGLIDAEAAEDDARCGCKHTVDVADYARNPKAEPKLVPSANYVRSFRHWSSRYGRMVWHYRCALCGHANTLPDDIPVNDEEVESRRSELISGPKK